MKRRVRSRDPSLTTLQERTDAVIEWDGIPQEVLLKLVRSTRERMEAVIRARWGNTRFKARCKKKNFCVVNLFLLTVNYVILLFCN